MPNPKALIIYVQGSSIDNNNLSPCLNCGRCIVIMPLARAKQCFITLMLVKREIVNEQNVRLLYNMDSLKRRLRIRLRPFGENDKRAICNGLENNLGKYVHNLLLQLL